MLSMLSETYKDTWVEKALTTPWDHDKYAIMIKSQTSFPIILKAQGDNQDINACITWLYGWIEDIKRVSSTSQYGLMITQRHAHILDKNLN